MEDPVRRRVRTLGSPNVTDQARACRWWFAASLHVIGATAVGGVVAVSQNQPIHIEVVAAADELAGLRRRGRSTTPRRRGRGQFQPSGGVPSSSDALPRYRWKAIAVSGHQRGIGRFASFPSSRNAWPNCTVRDRPEGVNTPGERGLDVGRSSSCLLAILNCRRAYYYGVSRSRAPTGAGELEMLIWVGSLATPGRSPDLARRFPFQLAGPSGRSALRRSSRVLLLRISHRLRELGQPDPARSRARRQAIAVVACWVSLADLAGPAYRPSRRAADPPGHRRRLARCSPPQVVERLGICSSRATSRRPPVVFGSSFRSVVAWRPAPVSSVRKETLLSRGLDSLRLSQQASISRARGTGRGQRSRHPHGNRTRWLSRRRLVLPTARRG